MIRHAAFRVPFAGALCALMLAATPAALAQGNPRAELGPGDNDNPDTVTDTAGVPGNSDFSDFGLLPVAFHKVQHFEWLGRFVDEEAAAQPDDNKAGHVNDDDGFLGLGFQGANVTVRARLTTQVTAHPFAYPAGSKVWVDAWIDWNQDGTFTDADEFVGSISVTPPFVGGLKPDSVIVNITGPAHGIKAPDYNVRLRVDWHDVGNNHVAHAGGEADGNINAPGTLGLVSFGEAEDFKGTDAWYIRSLGKGGSNGVPPRLSGSGAATPGSINLIDVELAKPNASALLFLSLTRLDVPFKGGTLLPAPDFSAFFVTDATGKITLPTQLPATMPAGLKIYMQFWIADTVSFGLAATDGLRLLTK